MALSKHLKSILDENAFTSHVYSILVNASTDQTMEQHLIVYCCYLGFQGRGCQMTSILELLVIKNAIGNKAINIFLMKIFLLEKLG